MKARILLLLFVSSSILLVGCKHRLIFTTQTSIGLDISGTANYPNKVSLSYNRYEGAIVPRKTGEGNDAHSVYGGLDADMAFGIPPKYMIKQIFTTGEAANLATEREASGTVPRPDRESVDTHRTRAPKEWKDHPLVFFTSTTFGLHVTLGEQEMSANALLGYRRSECSIIPIYDPAKPVRSVYADISIRNTEPQEGELESADSASTNAASLLPPPSRLSGVRMKQSFATGAAAENLVRTSANVKLKLEKAAGLKDEVVKEIKTAGQEGKSLSIRAKRFINGIRDAATLTRAIDAAKESGLLEAQDVQDLRQKLAADGLEPTKNALKEFAVAFSPEDVAKLRQFVNRLSQLR